MHSKVEQIELPNDPGAMRHGSETEKKLKSRDLIKASEAVRILEFYVGGRPLAKTLLIDLIRDGEIAAYARHYWTTSEKGIKAAWKAGPPEEAVERKRIKSGVFLGSSLLDEDRKTWQWKRSRFHVTHAKKDGKILRHFYRGVRFERSAVHAVLTDAKTSLVITHRGGRGLDEGRWSTFWLHLIEMQRDGAFSEDSLSEFGHFSKCFLDAYYAQVPKVDRLADATIDSQLRRAFNVLVGT